METPTLSVSPLDAKNQQPVMLSHFINGVFQPSASGKTFDSLNPATNEILATVALGEQAEINQAAAAAQQAFETGPWPRMTIRERAKYLRKIGEAVEAHLDTLAMAETLDTGKPITESREGDIPRTALNFQFFADYAASQVEECFTVNALERHVAIREPFGVAGLITPWNLPLYLATWKIAPAIVMGNSCVLKPAEWTPYTATLFAKILQEVDLPPGVVNIVHGFGVAENGQGAGESLTRHPGVKAISFTGETGTGKAIMAAASHTLKKVSFELGGKGASIIFPDADLEEAFSTSLRAAYRNQGQVCLAGSRLYVDRSIYEQAVDYAKARAAAIRVGDPTDPATEMGALISKEHLAKVMDYIAVAKAEGKVVVGGERLAQLPKGNFVQPTVVTGLTNTSRVCQEEIFGPVLTILPFDSEAEVVAMANSTPYGLSASVWSRDVNRCHRLSQALTFGMVWVNCWFSRDLRAPFGGQKSSGIGREGGRYALEFFSEAKTVCYRYQGLNY